MYSIYELCDVLCDFAFKLRKLELVGIGSRNELVDSWWKSLYISLTTHSTWLLWMYVTSICCAWVRLEHRNAVPSIRYCTAIPRRQSIVPCRGGKTEYRLPRKYGEIYIPYRVINMANIDTIPRPLFAVPFVHF